MSLILSRFLKDNCTVWRSTGEPDDFGQIQYGAAESFKCAYQEGGKLTTDKDGNQFVPIAEFDMYDQGIKIGDLIAFGTYTSTPDLAPANKIRKVVLGTEIRGKRDVTLMTG